MNFILALIGIILVIIMDAATIPRKEIQCAKECRTHCLDCEICLEKKNYNANHK